MQLLSEHNLRFLIRLCAAARRAIVDDRYAEFAAEARASYLQTDDERE